MAAPDPANPPPVSHARSLVLILAVCAIGLVLCAAVGWLIGGQDTALHAGSGMGAAAVGGLVAWAVLAGMTRPNTPVTAVPTLGLLVRLAVTGAGVGLAVMGLGFDRHPVLIAALFGYLVLMATETVLLYRFASSDRPDARPDPPERSKQDA